MPEESNNFETPPIDLEAKSDRRTFLKNAVKVGAGVAAVAVGAGIRRHQVEEARQEERLDKAEPEASRIGEGMKEFVEELLPKDSPIKQNLNELLSDTKRMSQLYVEGLLKYSASNVEKHYSLHFEKSGGPAVSVDEWERDDRRLEKGEIITGIIDKYMEFFINAQGEIVSPPRFEDTAPRLTPDALRTVAQGLLEIPESAEWDTNATNTSVKTGWESEALRQRTNINVDTSGLVSIGKIRWGTDSPRSLT